MILLVSYERFILLKGVSGFSRASCLNIRQRVAIALLILFCQTNCLTYDFKILVNNPSTNLTGMSWSL